MLQRNILYFNKVLVISALLMFNACHVFDFRSDDILLAKAYNSRLYLEDIQGLIPNGLNPSDSVAYVKQYVDRWLVNQVFLFHAVQSLPVDQMSIDQMVNDYKEALIMHHYELNLISAQMDTIITDAQIEQFYDENTAYFKLKDNVVNVTYIKLPLASREARRVRAMYRSSESEVLEELEELCLYHAATYYIGKDSWMLFSDILKDMPLNINNPSTYLRNNTFAEITDDYFRYFLYIHDYRLIGDVSPLVFERENIKMFILNQRKKEFIKKMRQDLFNQAIEANRVEVFL